MLLHWIDRLGIGLCFVAIAFGIAVSHVGDRTVVADSCVIEVVQP